MRVSRNSGVMRDERRPSLHSESSKGLASWTPPEAFAKNRACTSSVESMGNPGENEIQKLLRRILSSMFFDFFVGALVLLNFIILWYETDRKVKGHEPGKRGWTAVVQLILALLFVVEVCLKVYLKRQKFFASRLNTFDFIVVFLGGVVELCGWFADVDAKGFSGLLRICRVIRLFHIARLLRNTDEFWALISGLANASKTLFWASTLMFGILSVFSLVAVEALQPLMDDIDASGMYSECPWCKDAFNSVMESNLTLFGCISGGDWPMLARPLIVKYPWTGVIFVLIIFIMSFGMINLITAVIVDAAAAAREQDVVKKSRRRLEEQSRALHELQGLCTEMDADDSGSISFAELIEGFNTNPRFSALMQLMDIGASELQCVFEVLDKEKIGEVPHVAFTQQLWKMKSQEVKTSLMFVTHSLELLHARSHSLIDQNYIVQETVERLSSVMQDIRRDLQDGFPNGHMSSAQCQQQLHQSVTPRSQSTSHSFLSLEPCFDKEIPEHIGKHVISDCLSPKQSGRDEFPPVRPLVTIRPGEFLKPRSV